VAGLHGRVWLLWSVDLLAWKKHILSDFLDHNFHYGVVCACPPDPCMVVTVYNITYSKGRCGCEAFSIHPSVPSSTMDGIIQGRKPWQKCISPPLRMCCYLAKACPAPVSGLLPLSAVCCYLTGHKQCKHQDFQRPGSGWIHAECFI
jgi:hypothetical protein